MIALSDLIPDQPVQRHSRDRNIGYVLAYLLVLSLPAIVLAAVYQRSRHVGETLGPRAIPVTVTPRSEKYQPSFPIAATPMWGPAVLIEPPAWQGIVTSVQIVNGQTIADGAVIIGIDGVSRFAYHSDHPFFRNIDRTSSGNDVRELQEMLAALHAYHGPISGDVSTATLSAIRGVGAYLGVQGKIDHFDPAWVVWTPTSTFKVGAVALQLGQPAPTSGSQWLTGARELQSLAISVVKTDGTTGPLPAMRWRVVVDAGVGQFDWDPLQTPTDDDLVKIGQDLPPPTAESQADASKAALTGTATAPQAVDVTSLPATSIIDDGANSCVIVIDAHVSRPVRVSLLGVAAIDGSSVLVKPDKDLVNILANPAQILGASPSCSSS